MEIPELIDRLGYAESEHYLAGDRGDFFDVVDYGHIFRRAQGDPCRLRGVYSLREDPETPVAVPLVYVCEADTESQAEEVHKLVWNQDVVPFLIVASPDRVRAYPGFCHRPGTGREAAVEEALAAFDQANIERILDTLSAQAIDSGQSWRAWGRHIQPKHRIDWRLLGNLKLLDKWLQEDHLGREFSHALIGKYVYLHYLNDRGILSSKKLEKWGIPEEHVFGWRATVEGLRAVTEELDEWLNGDIFPIDFDHPKAPQDKHVDTVAAVFKGDEPVGRGERQLHLAFRAYDFSYIPIETLSNVYQQFLHDTDPETGKSEGRSKGAYYTPIPVVNFMLSELEEHRPFQRGMRVLDPACGSGAFLVQAYRRLIDKEFPASGPRRKPAELRQLLERHFFGVDIDPDACRIAALSLVLTLLDCVETPDLEGRPGRPPALPKLHNRNIFCGDFFDDDAEWKRALPPGGFDWVVGNPPWKKLKADKLAEGDEAVLAWILKHETDRPVGNREKARAFAWRAADYAKDDGELAFFLPAMSLFESAARDFRAKFLQRMQLHTVANFSNLAEVISGGRFRAPGASFFYRRRSPEHPLLGDDTIRTYTPLVANQEATRAAVSGERGETWSIVVNAGELREVPLEEAGKGEGMPWKIAAWGSALDLALIRRLERFFPKLGTLDDQGLFTFSEGPSLREQPVQEGRGRTEPIPSDLLDAPCLDTPKVKGLRNFFAFPRNALVDNKNTHLRVRGGRRGLDVCYAPHVIVSAARSFAVHTDQNIIIRQRQIGIISPSQDRDLLKALALYLSSDFAFYHQFLNSVEFGVKRDRATLGALKTMPVPLGNLTRAELKTWASLHDRLASETAKAFARGGLWDEAVPKRKKGLNRVAGEALIEELNREVYDVLGLAKEDRALVHDLVRVRLELNDGKVGEEAVRKPLREELSGYARQLRLELDSFVEDTLAERHQVGVIYDDLSGMVHIDLCKRPPGARAVSVSRADSPTAKSLERCREKLRRQRSQWVYFDRNLRVYEGTRTMILKPMQRFHWTRTQARIDAREIIAETLAQGE